MPGPGLNANPMLPVPYRVVKHRRETRDVFTLDLDPGSGTGPFSFAAGQFNMLYVFGLGEAAISISGHPLRPDPLQHTVRAVGQVTRALRTMKRGATIGVRGPFGRAWPVEESRGADILFIAGGIGLAPLRPAIYQVLEQRQQYGNVILLYGARTPDDLVFVRELEHWRGRFDMQVLVTVDTARRGWMGSIGVVTRLIGRAMFDPLHTVAMICGPEVMMRFTTMELRKYDLDPENIYITMERNMKCAVGFCGHCQYGPSFVCKDGPVFRFDRIQTLLGKREV